MKFKRGFAKKLKLSQKSIPAEKLYHREGKQQHAPCKTD